LTNRNLKSLWITFGKTKMQVLITRDSLEFLADTKCEWIKNKMRLVLKFHPTTLSEKRKLYSTKSIEHLLIQEERYQSYLEKLTLIKIEILVVRSFTRCLNKCNLMFRRNRLFKFSIRLISMVMVIFPCLSL